MSTYAFSVFSAASLPDTSGNVWFEPASLTQTNDRYPQMALRYKDTATSVGCGLRFRVPLNYVGNPQLQVTWTTTSTTGNAIWTFAYTAAAATATLDPSTDEETPTVTTAAPAVSQTGVSSVLSLTSANLAAGDVVQGTLARNGAGSDTIAADLVVYDVAFSYTDV